MLRILYPSFVGGILAKFNCYRPSLLLVLFTVKSCELGSSFVNPLFSSHKSQTSCFTETMQPTRAKHRPHVDNYLYR